MILHIDMDAFFASIEQAVNPRLKGRPLIVGSRANKLHTVVCAASYEAKALGIESGMASSDAFRLCPNLEFVPAEQSRYIWTSEQILELLKGFGFEVFYASIDEFQIDILDNPYPETLAKDIQVRIQETFKITASIGIAGNWLLAKLASKLNKPQGLVILTSANLEKNLAELPVEKLYGVGEKTRQILEKLGVKSCLELYQKSAQFLGENLGKYGLNLYSALHTTERIEPEPQNQKPKSIGHSYTLPQASENQEFIQAWIRLLAEMVARRLRNNGLLANTIHLWLNGPEIGNFGAQKTFQIPTTDGYEICARSLKIMVKIGSRKPKVRALGVSCSNLSSTNYLPLFEPNKRREVLLAAIDKLNSKLGDETIYPAEILISRKQK
jgi:DNA polymerase-4